MVAHNNRDILIVPYEDLPDEDKDVIGKAIDVIPNFKDKIGYKTICVPRNQLHTYRDKLKENTKHSALLHHEYLIHYINIKVLTCINNK